MYKIRRLL